MEHLDLVRRLHQGELGVEVDLWQVFGIGVTWS